MTRDAFARAVRRALLNAGFVNVRQKYLRRYKRPALRGLFLWVCPNSDEGTPRIGAG